MNVQASIVPSSRVCYDLPQSSAGRPGPPGDKPAIVPEASVLHSPRRRVARLKSTQPSLSAQARLVLVREHHRRRRTPMAAAALAKVEVSDLGLVRIATRCSRAELLAQRGVTGKVVDEIAAWLAAYDKGFCCDPSSLHNALTLALHHIEAMLEARDDEAFLAAFVALPEMRRSLGA